jgi:hypothetical protein
MPTETIETYDSEGNLSETRTVEVSQRQVNREILEKKAREALAANAAYIANPPPLATDVAKQVIALTKQNNGIIRLLLNELDSTQ